MLEALSDYPDAMLLRTFTCMLAVFAFVASAASPAAAEAVVFTDQRGDAPARYDLTRTSISNGGDRFVVVQRVRNLRGGRSQIYGVNAGTGEDVTTVHTIRRKSGTVVTSVFGSEGEIPCTVRARWRLGQDAIRISMPRDCIAGGGTVRASTMIGAGNGTAGDPADWTRTVRVTQDG